MSKAEIRKAASELRAHVYIVHGADYKWSRYATDEQIREWHDKKHEAAK